MKIVTRSLLVIFALITLQACSGIRVSQDYEQGYNFSELKTFSWKPNENNEYGIADNDLVEERISSAIQNSLIANGYTHSKSGETDFFISYHVTIEQKIRSNNVSGGLSLGRSSQGRYGSIGIGTGTQIQTYNQGTLLIDVTDVKGNKLVWRGISTQSVSKHSNPSESTAIINETVTKILSQFPPK